MSETATRRACAQDDVARLHEQMRTFQETKGYFFNKDGVYTCSLLEQFLATKARYGYMACPCRLANGSYELDKDIICPCAYREEDLKEFGSCFCGLYVSREWNEDKIPHVYVPDRRPPDKIRL